MKKILFGVFLLSACALRAQDDSADIAALQRMVNLSEVIVRTDLNVPRFLQRIKYDTSYYKAFKNLHILGYTAQNFIQMRNKRGKVQATLESKTRQHASGGCRTMEVLEEKFSGDFYVKNREYNYYTADLYDAFFFTHGKVCGENNIVGNASLKVKDKRGLAKNKEQLKMLFFNPGRKIPGVPFVGDKMDVFSPDVARYYNYSIDTAEMYGHSSYVFSIKIKEGLSSSEKGEVVFDEITTWFDQKTMEIVGRKYDLSYNAGVYDFDVHMEVQMTKVGDLVVPQTLRYQGNWFLLSKKRERGVFTATLYDFKRG